MKVVVTGATSFIGGAAIWEMLERGWQVFGVVRPNSVKLSRLPLEAAGLTVIPCDLNHLSDLPSLIQEPCDVFLHFGWGGSGSDARKDKVLQEQNVKNSLDAVRAARELKCSRFLFSGSQAEYGMFHNPMEETAQCRPLSEYGRAKLSVLTEASRLCREFSLDYGHIRIFSLYGPQDHPWSLVSSCLRTFTEDGTIELGSCESRWNFLYIEDAARGFCELCRFPGSLTEAGTVFNLAGNSEETKPLRFFVENMYDTCGKMGDYVYGVRPPNAEGEIELIPDINRIKSLIPWQPRISFTDGISRIIKSVAKWPKEY